MKRGAQTLGVKACFLLSRHQFIPSMATEKSTEGNDAAAQTGHAKHDTIVS